jgi:hypothetical protein
MVPIVRLMLVVTAPLYVQARQATVDLMPFREFWNIKALSLENELLGALSYSIDNTRCLSSATNGLDLAEKLSLIRTTKESYLHPKAAPDHWMRRSFGGPILEQKTSSAQFDALREVQTEMNFQFLNFTVLGNHTVSVGQEISFSFSFVEGSDEQLPIRYYLMLDLCENSRQERCWSGYLFIQYDRQQLITTQSIGSRTAGSISTAVATIKVGDWLAGSYRISFVSIPPYPLVWKKDYPDLQGIQFEKVDGFSFDTLVLPKLLKLDFEGHKFVVPGDTVQFKISVRQGSNPVSCSIYMLQFNSQFEMFWTSEVISNNENSVGGVLECTNKIPISNEIPGTEYWIMSVYLDFRCRDCEEQVGQIMRYWHHGSIDALVQPPWPKHEVSHKIFNRNPFFTVVENQATIHPVQLVSCEIVSNKVIMKNSTVVLNFRVAPGSFVLHQIIAVFISNTNDEINFGGVNVDPATMVNASLINATVSSSVHPDWKYGNYSLRAVILDYGSTYLRRVQYEADGSIHYDPSSVLGQVTHVLFGKETKFELAKETSLLYTTNLAQVTQPSINTAPSSTEAAKNYNGEKQNRNNTFQITHLSCVRA